MELSNIFRDEMHDFFSYTFELDDPSFVIHFILLFDAFREKFRLMVLVPEWDEHLVGPEVAVSKEVQHALNIGTCTLYCVCSGCCILIFVVNFLGNQLEGWRFTILCFDVF